MQIFFSYTRLINTRVFDKEETRCCELANLLFSARLYINENKQVPLSLAVQQKNRSVNDLVGKLNPSVTQSNNLSKQFTHLF